MLPDDTIIQAENLSKSYRIWASPLARLRGPLCRRAAELPLLPGKARAWLRRQAEAASREFFALHDVSFAVARGESVGIIGRNGAGKSTLLQILTGTLQPTAGSVEVRGRTAAGRGLGSGFNPEFTGRENARLNATLHGLSTAQIDARMEAILAFADIGDFVDEPVKTYSSGMMLRLAFAVIANIDADILIIDEALAVGDVFFVQKCMSFLRRFQQTGVLLFVSHDAGSIISLCQKAFWLDAGRLRQLGSPKEVTEAYLGAFYETKDGGAKAVVKQTAAAALPDKPAGQNKPPRDQRLGRAASQSPVHNEIQVFEFDPRAASFGRGGGRIISVTLEDEEEHPLAWIVGGEVVHLKITIKAVETLTHPIVGFYVKDRLGQQLFGDNTFSNTQGEEFLIETGEVFEARFTFQMPILPPGDYMVMSALANGTQVEHVMHHWIHDAIAFKVVASSVHVSGLIGIPMLAINLEKQPQPAGVLDAVLN